jgi:CRISPR-associated protein Cmr3
MRIRIKALDTLFFRDGKPFGMEDSTWATGVFPPSPSVFYGALRSLYFSLNPDKMGLAGTKNDPSQHLKINSILMGRNKNEIYYPCPADFVVEKTDAEDKDYYLLNLKKNKKELITSSKFSDYAFAETPKEVESMQGEYMITQRNFGKYSFGEKPTNALSLQDFYHIEPKVGIGRSNITRTSDEGKLYRVGMVRPVGGDSKQMDFWIDFDMEGFDLSENKNGFLKLGGEAKTVDYELIEQEEIGEIEEFPTLDNKFFKVVLLTPTVFQNTKFTQGIVQGWLPEFIESDFTGKWNGVNVKLIGSCIGKHKNIGGFNMRPYPHPKTMQKFVPEGSVYFFEILDEEYDFKNKKQFFHFSSHRQKEGFGLATLANAKQITA